MRALRTLAGVALALGCRRPPLPGEDAGAPTIDRTVPNETRLRPAWPRPGRPRADAGALADARAYALDGRVTTEREGAAPTGIVRMVRTRTGAALVWLAPGATGTDVVAQALDADGRPTGVPRVLRGVPGRVEAMDADARHGLLWVAFSSSMGTFGRWELRRTGALVATDDLAVARGPVIFEDLRVWPIQRRWRSVFAEVRAGDDGTAAALVSSDNTACPWGTPVQGRVNWVDCPGWKWFRVSQRPGMLADGRGGVVQPDLIPSSLTRVPQGWTYAHGPLEAVIEQPRVVFDPVNGGPRQRVLPAFTETVSYCDGPRVAWTGDTWVATCTPRASLREPEGTVWIRAVRIDGTAATPARTTAARLTGEVLRCFRGRPVVELRWDGGVVRLDPAHPDASFRLEQWNAGGVFDGVSAAVWAGRAVVGVRAATGELRRWGCNAADEVVAL